MLPYATIAIAWWKPHRGHILHVQRMPYLTLAEFTIIPIAFIIQFIEFDVIVSSIADIVYMHVVGSSDLNKSFVCVLGYIATLQLLLVEQNHGYISEVRTRIEPPTLRKPGG